MSRSQLSEGLRAVEHCHDCATERTEVMCATGCACVLVAAGCPAHAGITFLQRDPACARCVLQHLAASMRVD